MTAVKNTEVSRRVLLNGVRGRCWVCGGVGAFGTPLPPPKRRSGDPLTISPSDGHQMLVVLTRCLQNEFTLGDHL